MNQRPLGTSSLRVTPLGLGLAALGRPGYINLGHAHDLNQDYSIEAMQNHAHTILDEAWRLGMRYFDAARSYGRAEEFLGSWLKSRQIPVSEVAVGSKWGYTYTANWQVEADKHEVKDHSKAVLQRQWEETQANLSGYLNLYQIHSATLDSGVLDNTEVLAELARLKWQGVAIGLTLSGANQPDVLRKAIDTTIDGRRLFDAVQATWNLLEPSAGLALQEAKAAGMGVIVKEVLANGRLTTRNTDSAFADKLLVLRQQAERLKTSIDALSIAAALAQPWADIVLSGAATVEHLRSNIQALDVTWDDEAASQLSTLAESPEEYWNKRSELPWN